MGKESKKEWICVYVKLIHFAVQHTHNIINQLHANKNKNKKDLQDWDSLRVDKTWLAKTNKIFKWCLVKNICFSEYLFILE